MAHGITLGGGINAISAGVTRGTAVLGALVGATKVGEVVLRGLIKAGVALNVVSDKAYAADTWQAKLAKEFRPYRDETAYPTKELIIRGLALCALSTVVFHVASANWAFGPAPSIYNTVLAWLGPVRIDNTLHPALQFLAERVAPSVARFTGIGA